MLCAWRSACMRPRRRTTSMRRGRGRPERARAPRRPARSSHVDVGHRRRGLRRITRARMGRRAGRRGPGDPEGSRPTRITVVAPERRRCSPTPTSTTRRRSRTTPQRPEVRRRSTASTARSIRYSETLDEDMLYVAMPVLTGGESTAGGAHRRPADKIDDALGTAVLAHRCDRRAGRPGRGAWSGWSSRGASAAHA